MNIRNEADMSRPNVFLNWLSRWQRVQRRDVASGFFVFLIALPLCIGISVASGFPPSAGLITAIVGGVLVGSMGTAHVAIKGPAAGLIVVAIGAVTELGNGDFVKGYPLALAAILIAGILQVALGWLRTGFLTTFFPVTAVTGMLCAIGIIIVIRQLHPLLGNPTPAGGNVEIIAGLKHSVSNLQWLPLTIGVASLAILAGYGKLPWRWTRRIPAALWVLCGSVAAVLAFQAGLLGTVQGSLPTLKLPESVFADLRFPDFSAITSITSIKYIFMFTVVGSLETLLSARAVDSLDPEARTTNLNADLMAVGAGNILAPMLGGLPMITEVVRSSANVQAGGRSGWSNIFHGLFLLLFVLAVPGVLPYIPVAALAAILIYTGFRLASPSLFGTVWKLEWGQIAVFAVTVVMTISADLLVGICSGALIEIVLQLREGVKPVDVFRPEYAVGRAGRDTLVVKVRQAAVFAHIASLQRLFDRLPEGKKVIVDFTESEVVDYSFRESLRGCADKYERAGGQVVLKGIRLQDRA